jgi:hypothetical protein
MDKKKILIVCRTFYPEITPRAFRATELAKEMALQGHEVVVVTPKDKIQEQFARENNIRFVDLGKMKWKVPSFGNKGFGYILTRSAVRLLQLSIEYPDLELVFKSRKVLRKLHGFDLLISIAVPYPIHWGVASIWSRKNKIAKTWVADCGDPYMGERTDTFKKWFYFKYVEKWFMRKANFISIPIESAKEAYYTEFHKKIKVIPQGFKFEKTIDNDALPNNPVPHFAYAGGFIHGMRDPRALLEYLSTVESDFRFYIYTRQHDMVSPFIKSLKGKLILKNYIPREQLLKELTRMDFLVNFDNNTGVQLPSKLIDYSIINRPVLNIKKEFDINTICNFFKGDYTGRMVLGDLTAYKIENVANSFLELCK